MKIAPYLSALMLVASFQAWADESEIRFYDVEVIIFKNDKGSNGREFLVPESTPVQDENMLDLASEESIEALNPKGYNIVPPEEMRLTETATRIDESSRYTLMTHIAWRQPGTDKDKALPVWIRAGKEFGEEFSLFDHQLDREGLAKAEYLQSIEPTVFPTSELPDINSAEGAEIAIPPALHELEGTITISLSRYLHAYVDLVLRKPRLRPDPSIKISGMDQFMIENLSDAKVLNNYSLKERRRMRSKKLHYLDSPQFGMLIIVTPYEAPEPEDTTIIPPPEAEADVSDTGEIQQ